MTRLQQVIQSTIVPATIDDIRRDLTALGVAPGMTLAVHSSLSACGYVVGGAVAIIPALEQALGEAGTLAMPTHSMDASDPDGWSDPAVPEPLAQTDPATRSCVRTDFDPPLAAWARSLNASARSSVAGARITRSARGLRAGPRPSVSPAITRSR
jgi:Aminoglycoside 3-N-acetyltransferase